MLNADADLYDFALPANLHLLAPTEAFEVPLLLFLSAPLPSSRVFISGTHCPHKIGEMNPLPSLSLFLSFSTNCAALPKYLMPRYIYLQPTLSLCPTLVALIKIGDGRNFATENYYVESVANEERFVRINLMVHMLRSQI